MKKILAFFMLLVCLVSTSSGVEIKHRSADASLILGMRVQDTTGNIGNLKTIVYNSGTGQLVWYPVGGTGSIDSLFIKYGTVSGPSGWAMSGDTVFIDTTTASATDSVGKALNDALGNAIHSTYATKAQLNDSVTSIRLDIRDTIDIITNLDSTNISNASLPWTKLSQQVKDSIQLGISTGGAALDSVNKALRDASGRIIVDTYATKNRLYDSVTSLKNLINNTILVTKVDTFGTRLIANNDTIYSMDGKIVLKDTVVITGVLLTAGGSGSVRADSIFADTILTTKKLSLNGDLVLDITGPNITLNAGVLTFTVDSTVVTNGGLAWDDLSAAAKDSARQGASGTTDSIFVKKSNSTTTTWLFTGDTLFIDTTVSLSAASANFDTLGTKDTAVLYGAADAVMMKIQKSTEKIKFTFGTYDTVEFSAAYMILGNPGWTTIDTGLIINLDSIKDLTGSGLAIVNRALTVSNLDSSHMKTGGVAWYNFSAEAKDSARSGTGGSGISFADLNAYLDSTQTDTIQYAHIAVLARDAESTGTNISNALAGRITTPVFNQVTDDTANFKFAYDSVLAWDNGILIRAAKVRDSVLVITTLDSNNISILGISFTDLSQGIRDSINHVGDLVYVVFDGSSVYWNYPTTGNDSSISCTFPYSNTNNDSVFAYYLVSYLGNDTIDRPLLTKTATVSFISDSIIYYLQTSEANGDSVRVDSLSVLKNGTVKFGSGTDRSPGAMTRYAHQYIDTFAIGDEITIKPLTILKKDTTISYVWKAILRGKQ